MTTPEQRLKMASIIINYEARRDQQGHLMVYHLPAGDGGGKYEVAGINEKFNKQVCDQLVALVEAKKFAEAEAVANEFIAKDTDRAADWTTIPAFEFFFRDCVFNRGGKGGARIVQRAVGVKDDGDIGPITRQAIVEAQKNPDKFFAALRAAREQYERDPVGRDETSQFWKGLVNRWNKAIASAKTFPVA